ncbi:MAG: IS256 family transposase [Planctomycetota bacterium]|nr:IS256 family transposase [Planctomycetota bacterium]
MKKSIVSPLAFPLPELADSPQSLLAQILKRGVGQILAQAIEDEVQEFLELRRHLRDQRGRQLVVRNGHLPARSIQTQLGDVGVEQPRVRDHRPAGEREAFTSRILPPYLRRAREVAELVPWLYLKGISTGDMAPALTALLGSDAPGLSPTNVVRLKSVWEEEHRAWCNRSLEGKHYVYVWADGIYFNVRLEDADKKRQCILVLMGALPDGTKELLAVVDGYRESAASWEELIEGLKARGLRHAPRLAIGDGALGFWAAVNQAWPETLQQRCWVHKTVNVLNKMPRSLHGQAKDMLKEVWRSPTRETADKAFDLFIKTFEAKYPDATACLEKDHAPLLAYYGFPAQHWKHVRTTNPIESTFATVRLRTKQGRRICRFPACTAHVRPCAPIPARVGCGS